MVYVSSIILYLSYLFASSLHLYLISLFGLEGLEGFAKMVVIRRTALSLDLEGLEGLEGAPI
jgi:hypothetical protein